MTTIPEPATPGPNTIPLLPEPALPPTPIVWEALSSIEAESEWLELDAWVENLRRLHLIPDTVIPPCWHRHQLLVKHLSALRSYEEWAYHPDHPASAPFAWLRDVNEWQPRMRETVAAIGCRPGRCHTPRITPWPGQPQDQRDPGQPPPPPFNPTDRDQDLEDYITWDIQRRAAIEDHYRALILADLDDTGHTDRQDDTGGGTGNTTR
jgi:hypothetical protein